MLASNLVLPNRIAELAEKTPEAPFLHTTTGDRLSYAETHRAILTWADAFARHGISAGEQIALMMPNRVESVFGWLGSAWLRARQVPINTAYRGRILEHVLTNSGARMLVIAAALLEQLAAVDLLATSLERIVILDAAEITLPDLSLPVMSAAQFLHGAQPRQREAPRYTDVASITYTSGTTGASKGVIVYWAQLHATISALGDIFSPDDCWYDPMPMFHVGGQGPVYLAALAGARVVLREGFSVTAFVDDVQHYGCTVGTVVETMANFLMSRPPTPEDQALPLKYVVMIPVIANVDEFKDRFGVVVATSHGMTEISTCITSPGFDRTSANYRSCGRLRPGYHARIVDTDDEELPDGSAGELILRSDTPWTLHGGYLNMPEATVAAWRNGWFHTGDILSRDVDGDYYFHDRLKDAIRRRGENISSKEVEAEINAHPAVAVSAVVGVPSTHGEEEVKAFLILADGATLDPPELIAFLEPRLPRFMIPRFIEIAAELPQTPSAKVQKNLLRDCAHGDCCWDRMASDFADIARS